MTDQKRFRIIIIFSSIIIVLLTTLNLFLRINHKTLSPAKQSPDQEYEYQKKYYYRIIDQQYSVFMNEGKSLSIPFVYEGCDTIISKLFSEYVYSKHLVFYFSDDMCTPCINYCLRKIEEHFPDFKHSENVILLAKGIDYRFRDSFYGKPILSITNNMHDLISLNVPLFFIVDQNMQIELLFIPDELLPEYTDIYLGAVKSRFFSTELVQ